MPPLGRSQAPRRHSLAQPQQPASPYDVVSPVSTYPTPVQSGRVAVPYVSPPQCVVPVRMPPSAYMNSSGHVDPYVRDPAPPYVPPATTTVDYHEQEAANQSSEMMMLDQMSIQATVPVFGNDGLSNKSPYAIPDDFIAYLFNTHGGSLQQLNNVVQYQK